MDPFLAYRSLAYNNAWANYRLLQAVAKLDAPAFSAPRTGFFPSLSLTLNHNLIVDWFYVDALEGGDLGPAAWADREPCKTILDLTEAQSAVDQRLIRFVKALTVERFDLGVDLHRKDQVQHEPMDRLLLHLFQHQIHHRGQAHAMLSATSVAPPQLDEFFLAAEAPLRAGEFVQLGFTERAIFGDHEPKTAF